LPRVKCAACGGAGLVDRTREFVVHVPAGSQGGGAQRVPGEGSPGRRGGPAGDLHVIMRVRPHPFYRQEGDLLVCEVPITMGEAALGAEIEIPLLDATVRMKIPAATQSGAVFRVRGKGLPRAAGAERGDAHVKVLVETPANLSDEAKALIDELSGALGDGAYPRRQAFRAALKKGATA
jgi:molecular chaperone DnaJ